MTAPLELETETGGGILLEDGKTLLRLEGIPITNTIESLNLPINCVLAGNQEYYSVGRVDYRSPSFRTRTVASGSKSERLSGSDGFIIRTDSRGYD